MGSSPGLAVVPVLPGAGKPTERGGDPSVGSRVVRTKYIGQGFTSCSVRNAGERKLGDAPAFPWLSVVGDPLLLVQRWDHLFLDGGSW